MISLEFLEKVEGLETLSDSHLEALQHISEIMEFKRGDRIFSEGEDANYVWIVAEGDIMLRSESPGKQPSMSLESAVSFLSEAHAFGWTCFVPPYRYQLSGYCASRSCKVIRMGRDDLLKLFEKNEEIGYRVMSYLVAVVGKLFEQLQDEIAKKRGIEVMSNW